MSSLIEATGGRSVGIVESVGANAITVLLEPEAPQATALNTGTPAGFPRINGYLLIPNESGATVGVINFVRVERTPYPKRKGVQDFGLVDLPFPSRIVTLTPIGTLSEKSKNAGNNPVFEMRRGVDVFPSVGDKVLLPTGDQLSSIVVGERDESKGRIQIGTCPTAASQPVFVDPNRLFGRHVAVLGNTGAGKSCTVAGLIRWSLTAAAERRADAKRQPPQPNARFIVLDPNGEYAKAFKDLKPRLFQVGGMGEVSPLQVPAWLWNGEEWAAFSNAAPGVQRPILMDALRRLRTSAVDKDGWLSLLRARANRFGIALQNHISKGDHQQTGKREGVAQTLQLLVKDLGALLVGAGDVTAPKLRSVISDAAALENRARDKEKEPGVFWHQSFSEVDLDGIVAKLKEIGEDNAANHRDFVSEDVPCYFPVQELADTVAVCAASSSGRDVSQFVDSLRLRIGGLFSSGQLRAVAAPDKTESTQLTDWLQQYVGADQATSGSLAVLDLSLVPSEAVHVIVAVLGRLVFEAVQRHRRDALGTTAPTVLVLDEAHTFVHKDLNKESGTAAGRTCCRTFERIAREGRKFGLGLVLASQRPHEVSPTVLSQCNTFLLHRIVNDQDQTLVRSLVPDGLGELLRELPSLPSRRAIMLGWAAPAPVLVEIRSLPDDHRPKSPDPEFWETWTGEKPCVIDWNAVAEAWAGPPKEDHEAQPQPEKPLF